MASPQARRLRREPTDAERKMWAFLRHKQLDGVRFRRQQPMGPYIVDFFCPSHRLIIEIDGGQHDAGLPDEQRRTAWLESRGYRVMRFWNNEVLGNPEGVLETIRQAFSSGPPPTPTLPLKGGGRSAG